MNKKTAQIILILTSILWAIGTVLGGIFGVFAAFLFDSGQENIFTWIFATLWFALPLPFLASIILQWVFYAKNNYKIALQMAAIPLYYAILVLISGALNFTG